MTTAVGTCGYQAPEVLQTDQGGKFLISSQYTTRVDVYSFAVILFELTRLRLAWEEVKCQGPFYLEIMERVVTGERPMWSETGDGSPNGWRGLVEHCWRQDPEERPPMIEALVALEEMQALMQLQEAEVAPAVAGGQPRAGLERSARPPSPRQPAG